MFSSAASYSNDEPSSLLLRLLNTSTTLFLLICAYASIASGTQIPNAVTDMIDLSSLEQMGLAGSYGGLSVVTDTHQLDHIPPHTSSALLYKNATLFTMLASTSLNGTISSSCRRGNDLYIAGHFQSINQQLNVGNVAKLTFSNSSSSDDDVTVTVTPLGKGVDGPVYAMYCDVDRIYVGGDFLAPVQPSPAYGDSLASYGGKMAMWMISNGTWSALPWKGVNGPVYAIDKFKNQMYFAGQFDSTTDGQLNHAPASQPIDLSPLTTTLDTSGSDSDYNDAAGLVCSPGDDHPWLLEDNTPGYWQASFLYAVSPSLFRLNNTHYEGRGTDQFGILSLSNNHYFNMTFLDPVSGNRKFCTNNCSLSDDPSIQFQDFLVLDPSLTSAIRIEITSWYGLGGGLSSVEIYQSEIFVHADKAGNFPDCSSSEKTHPATSSATTKGTWTKAEVGYTHYMISTIPANQVKSTTNAVTFTPYLAEPGNYTVMLYTPGCSDTKAAPCQQRTKVDVQIYWDQTASPVTMTIDQNSAKDRQDVIYTGPITAATNTTTSFQPRVVLSVSKSATAPKSGNVIVVANAVQWIKAASLPGLSSVLVYNPQQQISANMTHLPWSSLSPSALPWNSRVNAMEAVNSDLYLGGNFSFTGGNASYGNVVKLDGKSGRLAPLTGGGLDGPVASLTHYESDLYIGGTFNGLATPTTHSSISKNVVRYNTQQQTWLNLGGGVDGPVTSVLLTDNQTSILVSGDYTGLYNTNNSTASLNTTSGNTWWYPSTTAWAPTADKPYLSGQVYASGGSDFGQQYYLGSIKAAQRYAAPHGFVYINNQTHPTDPLPLLRSAAINSDQGDRITAGAFWNDPQHGNASTIILGGSFSLASAANTASKTIRNVALYQQGKWQGIGAEDWQGNINTMMVVGNRLFIGGVFSIPSMDTAPGSSSFAIYDLVNQTFVHVPDLHTSDGSPTLVNMIKYSDADGMVIVGGNFSTGGSLSCYGVCALDMAEYQWNNLGDGILGNVTDFVFIDNKLMVAGNLTLTNGTPVPVAAYDYSGNYWEPISSDSIENGLPGPCHAVSYDNNTRTTFFAGQQTNLSTAYIRMWNGQQFTSPNQDLGPGSIIQQLSVLPTITNTTSNLSGNTKAVLLVTGFLNLGGSGNVSAALYNGTTWIPYLVASASDGTPGVFGRMFFKSYNMSVHNRRYMAVPFVILVSIASSLGVTFVLILASLVVLGVKRRHEAKVECAQPWTYAGKPPLAPDALLDMLTSGALATTGLYALSGGTGSDHNPDHSNEKGDKGLPLSSHQDRAVQDNGGDDDGSTYGVAALGTAAALGAGAATMRNITPGSEKPMSPPPAAYLSNPSSAFDGPYSATSREMAGAPPPLNTQRSSLSTNPFRVSSPMIGMAYTESPTSQQQQDTHPSRGIVQGDVRWTDVNHDTSTLAYQNLPNSQQQQKPNTAMMTTMTMPVMSLAQVERFTHDSVLWPSNGEAQQQQQNLGQQPGQQPVMWTQTTPERGQAMITNNTTRGDDIQQQPQSGQQPVVWTHTAPERGQALVSSNNMDGSDTQQQQQLGQQPITWSHTTPERGQALVNSNITDGSDTQQQQLEQQPVTWTHTVPERGQALVSSNNMDGSDTQQQPTQQPVMWTNTVPERGQAMLTSNNATDSTLFSLPASHNNSYDNTTAIGASVGFGAAAVAAAAMGTRSSTMSVSTTSSSVDQQPRAATRAVTPSPFSTYTSALNYQSVNDSNERSASKDEDDLDENRVRWTHFDAEGAQDRLVINQMSNTTPSMYSQYSLGDYLGSSPMPSTNDLGTATSGATAAGATATPFGLGGDGLSSDPDIARWTTAPSQQQPSSDNVAAIPPLPVSTRDSNNSHEEEDRPGSSMERTTYTSGLRFSSVILPDDIALPRKQSTSSTFDDDSSSRRSSMVSSLASSYHQTINDFSQQQTTSDIYSRQKSTNDVFSEQQQPLSLSSTAATNQHSTTNSSNISQPPPLESFDTSTSEFRWSDIVASSSPIQTTSTSPLPLHPQSSSPPLDIPSSSSPPATATATAVTATAAAHSALDGRAASKKMIQDYFSSRDTTTAPPPAAGTLSAKRQKYKSDFKRAMQAALENNSKGNTTCSQEHPHLYVAKFDFSAREHGELGFEKGDPIIVIDAEDDIWWMGYKDFKVGKNFDDDDDDDDEPPQGVFPSNYVERATFLPY